MTDAAPGIVVTSPDPTENVRELFGAEKTRNDDLRKVEGRRFDDALTFIRTEMRLLATHAAERARVDKEHAAELRRAEAARIDANRAVDVNAVGVAVGGAQNAAAVLAAQVLAVAERTNARLSELERTKYEGAGRSGISSTVIASLSGLGGAVVMFAITKLAGG